jgi:hypothetical protein
MSVSVDRSSAESIWVLFIKAAITVLVREPAIAVVVVNIAVAALHLLGSNQVLQLELLLLVLQVQVQVL